MSSAALRDLALREHAAYNRSGMFDETMSTFFRNVDSRFNPPVELPVTGVPKPIATLKARAVLVDMEEGVLNELCRGSLGELFDDRQLIKDVSGSGNNFAHGHFGEDARDGRCRQTRLHRRQATRSCTRC